MKRHSRSGSSLFFIEFLIVLFFFLIISTICIRIFAVSHQLTQHTETLSQAQLLASNTAQILEADPDPEGILSSIFPDLFVSSPDHYCMYLDEEFRSSAQPSAYCMTLICEKEASLISYDLCISGRNGAVIYELPFSLCRISTREEVLS